MLDSASPQDGAALPYSYHSSVGVMVKDHQTVGLLALYLYPCGNKVWVNHIKLSLKHQRTITKLLPKCHPIASK